MSKILIFVANQFSIVICKKSNFDLLTSRDLYLGSRSLKI